MGRPRQPLEVLEFTGKKHLTNAEKEERKGLQITLKNDDIEAPAYLSKPEKVKFYSISSKLCELGIMTSLDSDSLGRYLSAETMYLKMKRKISTSKVQGDICVLEKYVNVQDKYFKQCRALASDMGLTITSRCRLVVPQEKEEKENKFAKFAGG